eukprot:CAMPEP_0168609342 /NCGR_PEP_ID=MMETSP0449_2-20121227/1148_1 /TAXON_ID=1082188 /ORGANISM="Strombidium rassoulzadegani, Strain ras09" /LENGTH=83 /DNA_ID=CAMNT_0008649465 /DNA_START=693 /DNA_END=944 /DNA_ORIENTATION=+
MSNTRLRALKVVVDLELGSVLLGMLGIELGEHGHEAVEGLGHVEAISGVESHGQRLFNMLGALLVEALLALLVHRVAPPQLLA